MSTLQKLQEWFASQCNGDWEHGSGIKIETLDNPGWSVFINLEDTRLAGKAFEPLEIELSEENWLFCSVEKQVFKIACGPRSLEEGLKVFLQWAGQK